MVVRRLPAADRAAAVRPRRRGAALGAFVFRLFCRQHWDFFLGGTEPDAVALAGAPLVLSVCYGRLVLRDGRGGAASGKREGGYNAPQLGPGVAWRNAGGGLGTVVASMGGGRGDDGLPLFLLLPGRGTGRLLHPKSAAVPHVHRGFVHDVCPGVHELHGVSGGRAVALDDVCDAAARVVGAGLDARSGERGKQCRGRFSERASGRIAVSAAVRLAARTAPVLGASAAVHGSVVVHHVFALPLLCGPARRRGDGAGGLGDGASVCAVGAGTARGWRGLKPAPFSALQTTPGVL